MSIGWSDLRKVADEQGSSFYVVDTGRFNQNYTLLLKAFRDQYIQTNIAYSYKTNYIPTFCRNVASNGGFAEVVSNMELKLALRLGVLPGNIFFNGPYKDTLSSIDLLERGGIVNIDCIEELERLEAYFTQSESIASVGVRCNFDVEDSITSRFGFDASHPEFLSIIERISRNKNFKLTSLHCHFASRSIDCWMNRSAGMVELMTKLPRHILNDLSFVSLGGGMYGRMPLELERQFPLKIPTYTDYAAVAARPFSDFTTATGLSNLTLIIEPGTAVVADAVTFVAEVQSIKSIRGQTFITLNGSSFNLGRSSSINLPLEMHLKPESGSRKVVNKAKIVGYTCIEGDILCTDYSGPVGVGDFVAISEAGSYSVVMKPPFILPNAAIIEFANDGKDYIVHKRAETFEDVFLTYGV